MCLVVCVYNEDRNTKNNVFALCISGNSAVLNRELAVDGGEFVAADFGTVGTAIDDIRILGE